MNESTGLEIVSMVKEVASATGKGIDFLEASGVSSLIKKTLGSLENRIDCMEFENQIKTVEKIIRKLDSIEYPYTLKPIELKLAKPFLEAVSLETDDYLQDLWSNLLINSSIEETGIELNRIYIDILKRLSQYETKILLKIYDLDYEESKNGILTYNLPKEAIIYSEETQTQTETQTLTLPNNSAPKCNLDEKIVIALSNLDRLGCISSQITFGPSRDFSIVAPTILGKNLVESLSEKYLYIEVK